jgi:transcriptional regulator of acetoin/glycerol metabolism
MKRGGKKKVVMGEGLSRAGTAGMVTQPSLTGFGLLVATQPDVARTALLGVLRGTDGNMRTAAKELGVSRTTLYKWLERLDLEKELESLRR